MDTPLKEEIKRSAERMATLRDEVRVKIHLANMDLKDAWAKLEPEIHDVEKAALEATETSRGKMRQTLRKLEKFAESLF